MIVNYHFYGLSPKDSHILYKRDVATIWNKLQSTCFAIDEIEVNRIQCWASMTGLVPNSTYHVTAYYSNDYVNTSTTPLQFRTGPINSEMTIISGGDLSWSRVGIELAKEAALNEPLLVAIGGDISYDNGDPNCYLVWDQWFSNWNKYMITPSNYSIPILVALGNHEAGSFMTSRYYNTFTIKYFPHETNLQSTPAQDRPLNHVHKLSRNVMMMVLDSWVHESPMSQVNWINQTMRGHKDSFKFAIYHSGMFPYRKLDNHKSMEAIITTQINQHWRPLFDEYNLTAAFENHYHAYKKTYQIKNDKIVKKGTFYLGDGCWGVETSRAPFSENPRIQDSKAISHFYLVKGQDKGIKYQVVTFDKEIEYREPFYSGDSF